MTGWVLLLLAVFGVAVHDGSDNLGLLALGLIICGVGIWLDRNTGRSRR